MNELYGFDLYEKCLELIDTKHNVYFKNSELVDEILAEKYDVTLSYIVHTKKRLHDPYLKEKKSLRHRVRGVLTGLENEGLIEKYSKLTWKKVKI